MATKDVAGKPGARSVMGMKVKVKCECGFKGTLEVDDTPHVYFCPECDKYLVADDQPESPCDKPRPKDKLTEDF